jgi:hypothetical protein
VADSFSVFIRPLAAEEKEKLAKLIGRALPDGPIDAIRLHMWAEKSADGYGVNVWLTSAISILEYELTVTLVAGNSVGRRCETSLEATAGNTL